MPTPKPPKTPTQAFDEIPPFICRSMAVISGKGKKTRRIPVAELIKRSGIKRRRFQYISKSVSWGRIKLDDISKFAAACGVDLLHRRGLYQFYRVHMLHGMKHLTRTQRARCDELVRLWKRKRAA